MRLDTGNTPSGTDAAAIAERLSVIQKRAHSPALKAANAHLAESLEPRLKYRDLLRCGPPKISSIHLLRGRDYSMNRAAKLTVDVAFPLLLLILSVAASVVADSYFAHIFLGAEIRERLSLPFFIIYASTIWAYFCLERLHWTSSIRSACISLLVCLICIAAISFTRIYVAASSTPDGAKLLIGLAIMTAAALLPASGISMISQFVQKPRLAGRVQPSGTVHMPVEATPIAEPPTPSTSGNVAGPRLVADPTIRPLPPSALSHWLDGDAGGSVMPKHVAKGMVRLLLTLGGIFGALFAFAWGQFYFEVGHKLPFSFLRAGLFVVSVIGPAVALLASFRLVVWLIDGFKRP